MNDLAVLSFDCTELRRRLSELHEQQPPADPATPSIRIGIEDAEGALVHVVEASRLVEAVKVFEVLGDYGLEPRNGRHRTQDGRRLTRLYSAARPA
ncbi:hypothetical protein [Azohydromonas caseinilytica]|uniref:Uncharacterized protein n=1 Tax=Azohydromonas caseinilytica TaxID=2728836 RepID=A0A848FG83_9BURK|nr:hypothetical protein [Azohydromonas caseinilytica]NML17263.1 hypothetical protein [Azohydromonas caseinilytica]